MNNGYCRSCFSTEGIYPRWINKLFELCYNDTLCQQCINDVHLKVEEKLGMQISSSNINDFDRTKYKSCNNCGFTEHYSYALWTRDGPQKILCTKCAQNLVKDIYLTL